MLGPSFFSGPKPFTKRPGQFPRAPYSRYDNETIINNSMFSKQIGQSWLKGDADGDGNNNCVKRYIYPFIPIEAEIERAHS